MKRFNHLFGLEGRFMLHESRGTWMPVNDGSYCSAPPVPAGLLRHELFVPADGIGIPFDLPDNIKIFSDEARALEQQRLLMLSLQSLADNLRASQAEYGLEKLIESIDFHMRQEDWLK